MTVSFFGIQIQRRFYMLWISLTIVVLAVVIGWLVSQFSDDLLTFTLAEEDDRAAFWTRFYYMAAVSVLVERSVEVYLKIVQIDGKKVMGDDGTFHVVKDASAAALATALVLSALLAFVGLRILDSLLVPSATLEANHPFMMSLFFGVDVIVSAGLMAGGATIFHPLAKALIGLFEGLDAATRRAPPSEGAAPQATVVVRQAVPPAAERSIASLDLAEHALSGARTLRQAHPDVVFTSGRRDVAGQARAMADNVVKNRKWIEQTYVPSPQRTELQTWVDDNPGATTAATIAAGLEGVMTPWTDAQKLSISRHMVGLAFDVQPIAGSYGEEVKATIRALPNLHKFLEKEGGLVIWHAQFDAA